MLRTKISLATLATLLLLGSACSKAKAPGTWMALDTGTGDAFYSVNFVNENTGWINGQTDRGFTPPEGNANGNGNSNANANANARPKKPGEKTEDPLKANQGFEVLQTTDGGLTWTQIPDQFKNKIRSVWFIDTQRGWALTIDRDILSTLDGGITWALQRKAGTVKLKLIGNRRQPEMDQPEQVERLYFIDAKRGWAWGGGRKDQYTEQPGILLATIDGGQNWNPIPYPFEQSISDIFFLDAQRLWASVTNVGFFKSTDGGLSWAKIQGRMPEDAFRAIFFLDDNNGWVVGRSGRLAKTADGGRTWLKMVDIKQEFLMRDIFFTDSDHGWAVGDNGAVLYTPDGGASWVSVAVPAAAQLVDITFINKTAGWAVGMSGAVLKYQAQGGG